MLRRITVSIDQIKAMASPVRAQIIAVLLAEGDRSISEIAAQLGRRPDSLYHHVRIMEQSGLIEPAGHRTVGRNREALYRASADAFTVDRGSTDPNYQNAICQLMRQHAREAVDQLEAAYADPDQREAVFFETLNVRLSPEKQAAFRADLAEILIRYRGEGDAKGQRVAALLLATPVPKP